MKFIIIIYLLLEFYFSLGIWGELGFIYALMWVIFSMMLGFRLLKSSSLSMKENLDAVNLGKLSLKGLRNASLSRMIGAFLLVLPGVVTDSIGLLLVIYTFYLQFIAKITPEQTNTNYSNTHKGNEDENIIDVEIIDERDSSNTLR